MAHSEEDVIGGMLAVIGSTSFEEASQKCGIPASTLKDWCNTSRVAQYEKLREDWAGKIEAQLASDLLDNARLASRTERLAIEAAKTSLENETAREPAKIARDISQVKAQAIDKRLALQGRPTQITERRDVGEIVRALVGMRVLTVSEPEEIPDATTVERVPEGPSELVDGRHLEAVG